ncbi:MAG: hypothetical protein GF344_05730 [Chitinivibrionales bacterium]|nr:hypothetical protein [Chitinivibrionales bacterium]
MSVGIVLSAPREHTTDVITAALQLSLISNEYASGSTFVMVKHPRESVTASIIDRRHSRCMTASAGR